MRLVPRGSFCVARSAWRVPRGSFCVAHSAWLVLRGSFCVARSAWLVPRGSFCMARSAWRVLHGSFCVAGVYPLPLTCFTCLGCGTTTSAVVRLSLLRHNYGCCYGYDCCSATAEQSHLIGWTPATIEIYSQTTSSAYTRERCNK